MIAGKRVVVTGKVAGESRQTAEAKLRDAGAIVQSAVTKDTDLLVTGEKVGASKIGKAQLLGVTVVPWEQAFNPTAIVRKVEVTETLLARQVAPMLAKGGELPPGPGWLFEVKWDGYRCVATVAGDRVAMQSRSGRSDYTEQFPKLAAQLRGLPDCVVDGELVVLDEAGDSAFGSMGKGETSFVAFDLLEVMGESVRDRPLTDRRRLLGTLAESFPPGVTVSPTFEDGEKLLAWAADRHLEGIVAKRENSPYREGTRTDAWIKIKLRCEQEFVVVGWIPGEGAMQGAAGSLLLAVNEDDRLRYCGRVGSGLDYAWWQSVCDLPPATRPASLDVGGTPERTFRDVVWVEPQVVQVRFQRWTEDGHLWHPSVQGFRYDKAPAEVVRERAAA